MLVGGQQFPVLLTAHHREPPVVYQGDAEKPPHFFLTPAYDLNVGHAMKVSGIEISKKLNQT